MVEMEAKQRDVDETFAEEPELTGGALRAAAPMGDAGDLELRGGRSVNVIFAIQTTVA